MADNRQPTREQRFAVISRKVIVMTSFVLAGVAVWAFTSDRTALGIAMMVTIFVLVFIRAMWTVRRGFAALSQRKKAEVPDAPVASPDAATPVDQVVAALVALNDDGLPYRIDAATGADGVQVEVRWKSEEMRWQTLFVRGRVSYAWRMEITLNPATTTYKFVEYSGRSTTRAAISPGGAYVRSNWTWTKGKTSHQRSATFMEGADGQIVVADASGSRASWEGATMISPSDAKKPVFTVLRNHGWRPRFDWFGARLFEK